MNKVLLILLAFSLKLEAQTPDEKKSPNSFIFNLPDAISQNYGGMYIPVSKAYAMWSSYEYLKTQGNATPIPNGVQKAEIFWEDKPGLIKEVSIVAGGAPENSKIKVDVNKAMGNGNAVISFKVNDQVYWSWHVWVTDDPSNGVTYSQGFETDKNGNAIQVKYMDRNLGAQSNHFLGNDWHKSSGLMYQWGRKDPFPPMVYKDLNYYEINSVHGTLYHDEVGKNKIPVQERLYNEIEKNIQFSVKNPLTYVINTDNANWFSSSLHKTVGAGVSYTTWDLWSDNYRGGNSNGSSSNAALRADSRSYELKSELDPCPSGWRVPSHYGRVTINNNLGPWGRKSSGGNDDLVPAFSIISPDAKNDALDGIKVYPSLGMDFTNSSNGSRNIGIMPITGNYEYYPNSTAPNAEVGIMYQDENSDGGLWSATFGFDGGRMLGLTSDPLSKLTSVGRHGAYVNQTNPSKIGNAVRCMQDPNLALIGDFPTEFFTDSKVNFKEGLEDANSYIVTTESRLVIPVRKAFAVHNQLLSDNEMLPASQLVAKVLWTTNSKSVRKISINKKSDNGTLDEIQLELNNNEKGNFVVSLHNGSTTNPAYWSWHVWMPDGNPTQNTVTYITEQPIATNGNFVNPTKSLAPPLVTTFMDRNLGSVKSMVENDLTKDFFALTKGLHFQWGRKDALPNFAGSKTLAGNIEEVIFLGSENQSLNRVISYTSIDDNQFKQKFTKEFSTYESKEKIQHKKITDHIDYSVKNPLSFLYQQGIGQLYDGGNHYSNDLTQVRDWVADDNGKAYERWGHGGKKSPFDPCPSGWRVPDVSMTILYSGSKGNSPFYNGHQNDWAGKPGVIQDQWANVNQYYKGNTYSFGWVFKDSNFPIGAYSADGIRGELGENDLSNSRSGVWLASMADRNTGFALSMVFEGNRMQTGAGAYPQAGMSVRCAKDEARYLGVPIAATNRSLKYEEIDVLGLSKPVASSGNNFYPNPFVDQLSYKGDDVEKYEMYDMTGALVKLGKIINNAINGGDLLKGMYIIKVTLVDGSTFTKKVIKQ